MASPVTATRRDNRGVMIVAALTIVALLLRAIGANGGLWIDEIYALLRSFRLPLADTLTRFPNDNHHPLYSALAHLSITGFGEAPWAIRLPSIVFGTASVPALYVLGRHIVGHREALLAAALLAVSWHHVWFSQNARGYVMLAFFAIACTGVLLRLLDRPDHRMALLYAALAALGAFTHLTMIFIVVGHALAAAAILAIRARTALPRASAVTVAASFVMAAGFTLALHAPMLGEIIAFFTNRPSGLRGVSTPGWALAETARMLAVGFGAGSVLLGAMVITAAVALFCVGIVAYARYHPAALVVFLSPVIVIMLGAALARGTFYPRFLFALIAFGILIGIRGVLATFDGIQSRLGPGAFAKPGLLGTAVTLGAIALSLITVLRTAGVPKQDFVGAAQYVETHRQPGDRIATTGITTVALRDYLQHDVVEVGTADDVGVQRAQGTTWLVYAFPRYIESSTPEVMSIVRAACPNPVVFPGTTGDGAVMVCRLERAA